MNELLQIQSLLKEVNDHLVAGTKGDRRKASEKLRRLATVATTFALMLESQAR